MSNDQTGADPLERLHSLGPALLIVAVLLVVWPLADLALNSLPAAPGEVLWRYGTVGMFSGFVLTPLLGVTLATMTATALEQRLGMKLLVLVNLVVAVLLLGITILFVLDAVEMRASVPPERVRLFDIGAGRAIAKIITTAIALAAMGVAGIRSIRELTDPHPEWIPRIIVPPELEGAVAEGATLGAGDIGLARAPQTGERADREDRQPAGSLHGKTVAGTVTATEMTTDLPVLTDGGYVGRTIVWYTGGLAGRTATVTGYDPDTSTLTFDEMPVSSAEGDKFVVVSG